MRAILAALALCACAFAAHAETGIASVYGGERWHNECGRPVAAGGVLDCNGLTAAIYDLDGHRVRFGTLLKVCRIGGNCIVVRVNDRGPAKRLHRLIDLTPSAARALGFSGLAHVTVEPLGWTPHHGDFGGF